MVPREVVGSQPDAGEEAQEEEEQPPSKGASCLSSDLMISTHCSRSAPAMLVLYVRSTTVLAVGNTQTYYFTFAGCSVSVDSVMVSGRGGVLSEVQQELLCLSRTSSLQVLERRLLAGSGFRFLPRGPLHMTACPVKLAGGSSHPARWRLC